MSMLEQQSMLDEQLKYAKFEEDLTSPVDKFPMPISKLDSIVGSFIIVNF